MPPHAQRLLYPRDAALHYAGCSIVIILDYLRVFGLLQSCFTSTETVEAISIRDGSPVPLLLHTATELWDFRQLVRCCFTSTETVGTIRDHGEVQVHLLLHTAAELLVLVRSFVCSTRLTPSCLQRSSGGDQDPQRWGIGKL